MPRADHIDHHDRLDHFAELLSLDLSIPIIRERMGLSRGGAHRMMERLREQFGSQAQ